MSAPPSTRRHAMDLLARREHSYFELQRKLSQRGFPASEITDVLDELQAERLLNDQRFAEAYTRSRTARGYGPARIKEELLQKGVQAALCQAVLTPYQTASLATAREVLQKKYGDTPPANLAEKAQRMRFLQYRGFSTAQIKQVLAGHYEDE